MSLKRITTVVKIAVPALLVIAIVLFLLFNSLIARSQQLRQDSSELTALGNAMLNNNDHLVKLMREYVVTQDDAVLREYESILNDYDSLDGKLDRMIEIGLSEGEKTRVDTLLDLLDKLAAIEDDAFGALDDGDEAGAFSIIFGSEYSSADKALGEQTKTLIADIMNRTETDIERIHRQERVWLAILGLCLGIAIAVAFILSIIFGGVVKPVVLLTAFMHKAGTTGDITCTPGEKRILGSFTNRKDEIGRLMAGCGAYIDHMNLAADELEHIAAGDLTVEIKSLSASDTMAGSLNKMIDNLNHMFHEIQISAMQVSDGSKHIADGAASLSSGSEEQAAAIDELSSTVNKILEQTSNSAAVAREAADMSSAIRNSAEKGSSQMSHMMQAVTEINDASGQISKVIKVIDDIAFQTNILALNAAVEAARAGQHGKGFAVVAEEVRNLASKSAEAAKDTGGLIENSVAKANLGMSIATETAQSLKEIVEGINRSSGLIVEVAGKTDEQAAAISHLNAGIDQVASVIQQNSATAEESSASSAEMSGQANLLEDLIAQFKLKQNGPRSLPAGRR
ncbi:MAG: methyl-accepting chemotaxis protein [Oscillospiraceae bacterium]|jgi:methyl-accepting chemotaxis protein|nr:methyl-accepting chemotaxis protein [Oscillospiraceae bacterium]